MAVEEGIIPIHIDDDTSSLLAILLNDDFYNFMLEGKKTVAGISVLAENYIIPFKMYAWLDLKRRKEAGEHVNERDYKKHKNDEGNIHIGIKFAIFEESTAIPIDFSENTVILRVCIHYTQ